MDRHSRRRVLLFGVMVWSLATMACGLARNFGGLFSARAFLGAGEAVLAPGSQSILSDMFSPERRAFPFAVYSLGSKLGQGASFLVGALLIALVAPTAVLAIPVVGDIKGWQAIFLIIGLPGLILAPLIMTLPEPVRRGLVTVTTVSNLGYSTYWNHVKRHPRYFVCLHLGAIFATLAANGVAAWAPAHFVRAHGVSIEKVGTLLGIAFVIGPIIALPLHGAITDRLFRRGVGTAHLRYLVYAMAISTAPMVAAFLVGDLWLSVTLLSIGQAIYGAFAVLAPVALQMMTPGQVRGKAASGFLLVSAAAGLTIGPTFVAAMNEFLFGDPKKIGIALSIGIAIVLPAASLSFWAALRPFQKRYPTGPAEDSKTSVDPF